ncbi:MAG TPA: GAF domain-containing protein [Solirubrobacteraceae bacterium]|nr:GAF domain-containing protein [Solirubrobacteraceae bacterium]
MSRLEVPLESIIGCLQGVIPSPFATVASHGMPNVTYMSIVQYVDSDRVAIARQFSNKTAANLQENPSAQVLVVDPATIDQYVLDLEYLATETEGSVFDSMQSNLEAISAHTGEDAVARLRGVDIHRVVACSRASEHLEPPVNRELRPDVLKALDDLARRLSVCVDVEDAGRAAVDGLADLLGFPYSVLFMRDRDHLRGAVANGYAANPETSEVLIGSGLIGVAAQRREVVYVPHLARSAIMAQAVDAGLQGRPAAGAKSARPIQLTGPGHVQSVAAIPLVANRELIGVLYLESEQPGTFGVHRERLLRIVGAQLASTLSALQRPLHRPADGEFGLPAGNPSAEPTMQIAYYQADDSVFVDGEYVIKGVPGRILWKLLRENVTDGRVSFTNRELRLDERLGLPAGNDNLDSRLIALRRRLAAGPWGIDLDRVGRGRLELRLERAVALTEVPTDGPMRHAHALPDRVE